MQAEPDPTCSPLPFSSRSHLTPWEVPCTRVGTAQSVSPSSTHSLCKHLSLDLGVCRGRCVLPSRAQKWTWHCDGKKFWGLQYLGRMGLGWAFPSGPQERLQKVMPPAASTVCRGSRGSLQRCNQSHTGKLSLFPLCRRGK